MRELREAQGVRARWTGLQGGDVQGVSGVPAASKPEPCRTLSVQAWASPSRLEALVAQCGQAESGWRLVVSLLWPLAACVTWREAQAEVHGLEE